MHGRVGGTRQVRDARGRPARGVFEERALLDGEEIVVFADHVLPVGEDAMVLDEPEGAEDATAADLGEDGGVEGRLRERQDEVRLLGLDRGEDAGAEEAHVGLLDRAAGRASRRKAGERVHAGGERRQVEDPDGVAELAERAGAMCRHRI